MTCNESCAGSSARGIPGCWSAPRRVTTRVQRFATAARHSSSPGVVSTHDRARVVQRATGYDYTLVNGNVVMESGGHTGALAGTLLRSGPDVR